LAQRGRPVKKIATNRDGAVMRRSSRALRSRAANGQLEFLRGDYFAAPGAVSTTALPDIVVIRFGIANPAQHLHVPLLVTP